MLSEYTAPGASRSRHASQSDDEKPACAEVSAGEQSVRSGGAGGAGMAGGGASASGGGGNTATGWGCKRCTTVNDEAATHCAACETWRYDTANLSVLSRRQR